VNVSLETDAIHDQTSLTGACLLTPRGLSARAIGQALVRSSFSIRYPLGDHDHGRNKKADVAEHPWGFDQVGLLLDEPPGPAGLPFTESSDEFDRSFARSWMRVRTASESTFIMSNEAGMASKFFLKIDCMV